MPGTGNGASQKRDACTHRKGDPSAKHKNPILLQHEELPHRNSPARG